MTNNEIKIQALKTAIAMTQEAVAKIAVVVGLVNAAWEASSEPRPLPTGEYKRRAWLMADLTRMLDQIQAEVIEVDLSAGRPVCEETGRDLREWCGNDIEAAHAEALAINEAFDVRKVGEAPQILWDILPEPTKRIAVHNCHVKALAINDAIKRWSRPGATSNEHLKLSIEEAHAEALEINNAIDRMIDEREHVSNCSHEGFAEQDRLNRIGRGCVNELDKRLGEAFVKVRAIAMRLWADGFVTYPPEECGADYIAACVEIRAQWVR